VDENLVVFAKNSSNAFISSNVDTNGYFTLKNLEIPESYTLVVANAEQFQYGGTGGTGFTFYGGTHTSSLARELLLTPENPDIKSLVIEYKHASDNESAAFDYVVPWGAAEKRFGPPISLESLESEIKNGSISVDSSTLATSVTSGVAELGGTTKFITSEDSAADIWIMNPISSSQARVTIAEVTGSVIYLGRSAIVDDVLQLPKTAQVAAGLNNIVIVGIDTGKTKVVPIMSGLSKPVEAKKYTISGVLKNKKRATVSGVFSGNPSQITVK
jgi:hypothetical protein